MAYSGVLRTLIRSSYLGSTTRNFSLVSSQISNHTAKWMQDSSKKSPMELINEVPPIKVEGRIVACEGVIIVRSRRHESPFTFSCEDYAYIVHLTSARECMRA
ncbi:NADH dehydrogenase [ubiquinone] iron-sulfur protein 6, mitochondrial isoform X2 [Gossypium arboreum]|uniref:NADH dehydrogenase [ubiquinone] iron-sulfur protein 6, mitochondrial isoform X2 n=1 Tax=Gossypium arboreum TaxID=29729 RepID=UPI0022F15BA5|nr:NADH dehydrogenase [ubiquinone] iron-sulfur protein 6, mitochondrial isoform X2 [Gossypium arboreum]